MDRRGQRGFYLRQGLETPKTAIGADVASKSLFAAFLNRPGPGTNSFVYNPHHLSEVARQSVTQQSQPRRADFYPISTAATFENLATIQCPDALMLDHIAWYRHRLRQPTGTSVAGVIHVLCQNPAIDALRRLVTAPIYPWDGLVCPSTAVRDAVRSVLEAEQAYVVAELDTQPRGLPELPVIPLGVDTQRYAASPEQRRHARAGLGLADDETAILFVGRLDPAKKAHPFVLLRALEVLAQQTDRRFRLILAGWFPSDAIRRQFHELQQRLAPSVPVTELDGRQRGDFDRAWQSADIFCSLPDNIQETFGLTPLEAKAAGLPVVVSDWDGYRDTVRHGIDGFRVPTCGPSPTAGRDLLASYDETHLSRENAYATYAGSLSQVVAVDIEALLQALGTLLLNPEQRREMGAAAQADAQDRYDWRRVMAAYEEMWSALDARRAAAQRPRLVHLPNHLGLGRPYPFALFADHPSTAVDDYERVVATAALELNTVGAWLDQPLVRPLRPYLENELGLHEIVRELLDQPDRDLARWAEERTTSPGVDLYPVLAWLSKYGFVELYKNRESPVSG